MQRAAAAHDVSAVTAACLVVRRGVFERVGGFDDELAVAFGDVDLCLRIQDQGLRNLFIPHAELRHLESASRGALGTGRLAAQAAADANRFASKWRGRLAADPAYNPNLALRSPPFALAWPPRVDALWRSRPGSAVLLSLPNPETPS